MAYHTKMEGEKLSPGTMKNYVTTEDYVKRFIKSKFCKEDLFLKQLNQEFIIEFEYFIRNNPVKQHDPCAGNGLMKHMERLKKMVRWGWLEQDTDKIQRLQTIFLMLDVANVFRGN